MIEKDATPSPATDIKSNEGQQEELKPDRKQSDTVPKEKTEVKNAHASGDGSIKKED